MERVIPRSKHLPWLTIAEKCMVRWFYGAGELQITPSLGLVADRDTTAGHLTGTMAPRMPSR